MNLPDTQASIPKIQIGINRVGIDNLKLPFIILTKNNKHQHTVADISCFVNLTPDKKGINMSRIPIVLQRFVETPLNSSMLINIAKEIKEYSEADLCHIIYKFPYFMTKNSPESNIPGIVHYMVEFNGIVSDNKDDIFEMKVQTIATTLCPCSKEMSKQNAHNQKCYIDISVKSNDWIWIEDIVEIAENSSSCEIYSVLKRPDEKYVTDKMYENPKFVEDVVRDAYVKLSKLDNITSFEVSALADESIHLHSAFAKLKGTI